MFAAAGKMLIGAGALLAIVGIVVLTLGRLGLSRLPGDLFIQRGRFTFYFPVVTCLVLSLVLSLILTLVVRWRR